MHTNELSPHAPDMFAERRAARRAALACMVTLAVALGIGRFAFTPLLPLMLHGAASGQPHLDIQHGGWLASFNYAGYFVGAVACATLRVEPARMVRAGLVATVLLTLAMGVASQFWVLALVRFIGGAVSAVTFVFASQWGLRRLAELGAHAWSGVIYTGPGVGIVGTGLLVSAAGGYSASAGWISFGVIAAILSIVVWPVFGDLTSAGRGRAQNRETGSNGGTQKYVDRRAVSEQSARGQSASAWSAASESARGQPVQSQPAQTHWPQGQVAQSQSAQSQSAPSQSAPSQSARSQAAQSQSAQSQLATSHAPQRQAPQSQAPQSQAPQSQSAQNQPAQSELAQNQPAQSELAQSELAQSQFAQSQPAQSQPAQSQPAQSQRAQIHPARSDPAQSLPAESLPARSHPAQSHAATIPSQPHRSDAFWLIVLYGVPGFGYIITATFLPVIAHRALPGSPWPDLFWPMFGAALVVGALLAARLPAHWDNRTLLAACYMLQAVGIAFGIIWPTAAGFSFGSILIGLPFTAITLFAMREARRLRGDDAAGLMGYATAAYGVGQIVGPLVAAPIAGHTGSFSLALWLAAFALVLGAVGLIAVAVLPHGRARPLKCSCS